LGSLLAPGWASGVVFTVVIAAGVAGVHTVAARGLRSLSRSAVLGGPPSSTHGVAEALSMAALLLLPVVVTRLVFPKTRRAALIYFLVQLVAALGEALEPLGQVFAWPVLVSVGHGVRSVSPFPDLSADPPFAGGAAATAFAIAVIGVSLALAIRELRTVVRRVREVPSQEPVLGTSA